MIAAKERAVVFLDLDGTLVDKSGWISPLVLDGLGQLRQNGHLAMVCTGRPLCRVPRELWDVGLDGAITLAGGYAAVGQTVLYEAAFPRELALRLLNVCQEAGISCLMENNETNLSFAPDGVHPDPGLGTSVVQSVEELGRLYPDYRFSKLVMRSPYASKILPYQPSFASELTFQDTNVGFYEVSLKGVTKERAIRRVLDYLGRDTAGTYGIGDSENDIGMLDTVQTAIAMGNAQDPVKARAHHVTAPVGGDGVYWALRHYQLI